MSQTISESLLSTYKDQYAGGASAWRDSSARQKAINIQSLLRADFQDLVDVGSGDGAVLEALTRTGYKGSLTSLEISESGAAAIRSRNIPGLKEVRLFDGYHIPFADRQFRLATCSHVIEHVEHPRMLLREIARVSEYQILEIPIDFSFFVDEQVDRFLAYGHINIYTPALFKFLLKSEGFEVLDERFSFFSPEILRQIYPGPFKRAVVSAKIAVLRAIPFLRRIKPSAYTVLCRHSGQNLSIM